MAKEAEMPVVIHSRNAFKECVADCIDNAGLPWEKVIFHCFADGADEMRILQERGVMPPSWNHYLQERSEC